MLVNKYQPQLLACFYGSCNIKKNPIIRHPHYNSDLTLLIHFRVHNHEKANTKKHTGCFNTYALFLPFGRQMKSLSTHDMIIKETEIWPRDEIILNPRTLLGEGVVWFFFLL